MQSKTEKDLDEVGVNEIKINDLLGELMLSGNGAIFSWEMLIIYPIANQSQVLTRGIKEAIQSENYICAASLLRSLIESVMSLVYALSIPKEDEEEFYKQFTKHGRLRRWSKSKKCWENVRDTHLISQFEKVTEIRAENIYDKLCDILHFSIKHMQIMHQKNSERPIATKMIISDHGPKMPKADYDTLIEICGILDYVLKRHIAAEIHLKRSKNDEPISKIANKIIDICLVPHANKK